MYEPTDPQILIPKSKEKIRDRLKDLDWTEDATQIEEILQDLIAFFVSLDTVGGEGKNLKYFGSMVEFFLDPLIEERFLKVDSDKGESPFIMIHPEMKQSAQILEVGSSKVAYIHQMIKDYIRIPKVVIHCHFDTVQFLGKFGMDVAYKDKANSEMISGRGTNDMKSQLAAIILLLFKLFKQGNKNFFIFLTSTEEYDYKAAEDYLSLVRGALNLDLEPTSTISGVIVEGVDQSRNLSFEYKDLCYEDFMREHANLRTLISNILVDYTGVLVDFRISFENGKIVFSLTGVDKIDGIEFLMKRITSELTKMFKTVFMSQNIVQGHYGYKTQLSKYARATLEKSAAKYLPIVGREITQQHYTIFVPGSNNPQFGTLRHRFGCMFTEVYGGRNKNTVVTSIGEVGPRHSAFESASLKDLVNMIFF